MKSIAFCLFLLGASSFAEAGVTKTVTGKKNMFSSGRLEDYQENAATILANPAVIRACPAGVSRILRLTTKVEGDFAVTSSGAYAQNNPQTSFSVTVECR